MNVVAVSFGDTDCGDRNVVQARLDLVDAVGAPLATVRAVTSAGGAAESWRTAAEAARDGLFAADGRMALDVPAGGTLIPDLATYAQFWPMTIRGRAPLAINLAAATSAGFNPNQVWRTLASRVSLLRLAETFIGAIELVPWARMAAAYAYPGAWVVSPDHAPTLSDMQEFRLELTGRLASISLPSRV